MNAQPTDPKLQKSDRRLWIQTIFVFLVAALVGGLVVERSEHYRIRDDRARAIQIVQGHVRSLEQNIHRALSATYALAALVRQSRGQVRDFYGTATEMLPFYPGVGALQLAPGGIIREIVPLSGNEGALGHDLLKDPSRTKEAFLARSSGRLTLAGPFNLLQGGLGAVGRLPVFLGADDDERIFWGFTTVLIRFPEVLDVAGLPRIEAAGYDYMLWRIHPDSGQRQVIAASRGKTDLSDPLEHPIMVPNGQWTLSATPIGGWSSHLLIGKMALAAFFSVLIAFLARLLLRQPELLRRLVEKRTCDLREREDLLASLNELSSDWVWEQDACFRFTRFSPGMARILERDPSVLLGRLRWDSPNTLTPAQWDEHRRFLDAREVFRDFEYGIVFPDGSKRYISTSGQPIFDASGKFIGYRGTGKNITVRKQAEYALAESEARFQSLFENAPVALSVTTDEDGFKSTRWNNAWFATFGYPPEIAQGKSGNEIGLWLDPVTRENYISAAVEFGGATGIEVPMRCHDGRIRRICVSGRFVEAAGRRQLITFYDDVTEARSNECAIRELNSNLEARIDERTRELSAANAELFEALDQLRKAQKELVRTEKLASLGALVAGVAHELNTPIGNCLTVASTLAEKTHDFARKAETSLRRSDLTEYIRDAELAAKLLEKGMHRAHNLVAGFKQVAVDQSSEQRRAFDLATVVEEIVAMLQPALSKTPWKLVVEAPKGIAMDSYPGPLGQVIANLLNNAVAHAFEGRLEGTIRVNVLIKADDAILEVADDGVGMNPEVREHAFDPFYTTKLGKGGSGLGLHIVFNIVTGVLGGTIDLVTERGSGCRFIMRIPRVAPKRAAADSS